MSENSSHRFVAVFTAPKHSRNLQFVKGKIKWVAGESGCLTLTFCSTVIVYLESLLIRIIKSMSGKKDRLDSGKQYSGIPISRPSMENENWFKLIQGNDILFCRIEESRVEIEFIYKRYKIKLN